MRYKALSALALIVFASYTAYTLSISEQSLLAFGYQLISSPDTAQVVIDLYIMAVLAIIWMYIDCKRLGKPLIYWLAFAILTSVFISIGPLLYLVLRPGKEGASAT